MAKYVKTIYTYNVSYNVRNTGSGIAYVTEVDIRCSLNNRSEKVVTISLGDLQPDHNKTHSNTVSSTNKIVEDCYVKAYWFDY